MGIERRIPANPVTGRLGPSEAAYLAQLLRRQLQAGAPAQGRFVGCGARDDPGARTAIGAAC